MSDKNTLVLECWVERPKESYDNTHVSWVHVRLAFLRGDDSRRKLDYFGDYTHDCKPTEYYWNLQARAMLSGEYGVCSTKLGYYPNGYDCVEADQADYMGKTLRSIEKKLEKIRQDVQDLTGEWGEPKTFGEYVVRLANALKIKKIYWNNVELYWEDPNRFEEISVKQAADYVNRKVDQTLQTIKGLNGQFDEPVVLITSAPADFDGFDTQQIGLLPYELKHRQLRKVLVQPSAFRWQTTRYQSGNYGFYFEDEFRKLANSCYFDTLQTA